MSVACPAQVAPLSPEVTRRPPAYGLPVLTTYEYVPTDGFDTARTTNAYDVPAVTATGVTKVALKKPPELLEKPGIVAVARSTPVGRSPLAFRIETVRFGVVPVQLLQNRSTSTCVSWPLVPTVKVWPNQLVEVKAKLLAVTDVFC